MRDQMVEHIRGNSGAVTSAELAELFLKFKSPGPALAHRAVAAILTGDRRCRVDEEGRWHAVAVPRNAASPALRDMPWVAVDLLCPEGSRDIFHVGAWSVFPEVKPLLSAWLKDPATLSPEERTLVAGDVDGREGTRTAADAAADICTLLEARTPVFASHLQQSLCAWLCAREGETVNDDAYLLPRMMRSAGLTPPRPASPETCHTVILGYAPSSTILRDRAGVLAACVAGTVDACARSGIETREALDEAGIREVPPARLTGKAFTLDDLAALPPGPGVYAFTRADGSYLYIGKSTNLRQRVLGYFRPSDESPQKLERLRAESHGLTTHRCGSELESLIFEYRLIRKHRPALNAQTEVYERKGQFRPIDDCIIALPHAEGGKAMTFWFRRDQKIAVKPFDPSSGNGTADEVRAFFFAGDLPPSPDDFPEQEIAVRWVKRHLDSLTIVPVHALAGPEEVVAALQGACEDVRGA